MTKLLNKAQIKDTYTKTELVQVIHMKMKLLSEWHGEKYLGLNLSSKSKNQLVTLFMVIDKEQAFYLESIKGDVSK